jgi:hypothetical protein
VVVLFAHFAAWLLPLVESGLAAQDFGRPYVVSIRDKDQHAAWDRIGHRLDRRAFLVIEEPFSGDNVARPLTLEGALKMKGALEKAIQQLEAHPLARSLGVSPDLLQAARDARAAEYGKTHCEGYGPPEHMADAQYGYSLHSHFQYVGAH